MTAIDRSVFAAPGNTAEPVRVVRPIAAPADEVFEAFTDAGRVSAWLGVPATIDLAVGGRFELLFDLAQDPGLQGSEGCQILAFTPGRMVAFTWNSPPALPDLRESLTFVVVHIQPTEAGCEVELIHSGHGTGERWTENRRYFTRAWGLVLDALARHFDA